MSIDREGVRWGATISGVAALPLLAGATVFSVGAHTIQGPELWPCPMLALTGLPCPMCGATRTTVLLAHGDAAFLSLNPVWPVLMVLASVLGALLLLVALVRPTLSRRITSGLGRHWPTLLVVALIVGWVCALAHRAAIAS